MGCSSWLNLSVYCRDAPAGILLVDFELYDEVSPPGLCNILLLLHYMVTLGVPAWI